MNSILVATLGGATGGLLGSLLGTFLGRWLPEKWRLGLTTVFVTVLALVGSRVAVAWQAYDRLSATSIEAELVSDPAIGPMARTWREADREAFDAFIQAMSTSARASMSEEQMVNQLRARLQVEAFPRLLKLRDEEVLVVAHMSRDQFRQLSRTRPSTCRPLFVGDEPVGDITPFVDAELVQRELDLLAAAFGVDMEVQQQIATGHVFAATLDQVLHATSARVGEDTLLLTGEADATGRDVQFCNAAAVFFEEILELPQAEGAAFIRGLRAPV